MSIQWLSLRMALAAVCLCLLGLLSQASATLATPSYCTDINTSSMNKNISEYQSNGLCEGFCSSYSFAILLGYGCWCSDYAPASSTETSACSNGCPGFPTDNCGNSAEGLYAYFALSRGSSGTEGAGGSAPSITAVPVTVTATPTSITITVVADPSSSSSSETSSSASAQDTTLVSTTTSDSTSSTWTPTPVVSIFTTTGEVRTVTVTPTAPPNSQSGLGVQKSSSSALGTGGAVGLTVGLVALIAVIGGIIFFCIRRRNQREAEEYNNTSRRGSSAGLGGPVPSRTMSEHSRYVLGTDGRQVVETWEPGDAPGSRRSRLMPVDPRLDPFAPVYQRGENKSRESINTIRDDHDYSRRVVHQGPILRATNPDHPDD